MQRLPVNLTEYHHNKLRQLVYEHPKSSMSEHIRKALDLYFKKVEEDKKVGDQR